MTNQEFEGRLASERLQSPLATLSGIAAAATVAVGILLLFDPFDWLSGSPEVHEAKKGIALSITIISLVLSASWLMIFHPLQTGMIQVGGWPNVMMFSSFPRLVLRSSAPVRFRFRVFLNGVMLAAMVAFAAGLLIVSLKDLQKAKAAMPNSKA